MSNSPKVFMSYSWSSEEYEQWVLQLAEALVRDGVDLVLDKWHLEAGQDKYAFMETMVTDEAIHKVIILCDRRYAERADKRGGGVGTESQIISPRIYEGVDQKKFIPVVTERDENGKSLLPVFLRNRLYIDMSNQKNFSESYTELLRSIYDKPKYGKPPVGSAPDLPSMNYGSGTFHEAKLPQMRPTELYTGIEILCEKYSDRQILMYNQPYCIVDQNERFDLAWGQLTLVPLEPSATHTIAVQWDYLLKACGTVLLKLTLPLGQVRRYVYSGPLLMWSKGRIRQIR